MLTFDQVLGPAVTQALVWRQVETGAWAGSATRGLKQVREEVWLGTVRGGWEEAVLGRMEARL